MHQLIPEPRKLSYWISNDALLNRLAQSHKGVELSLGLVMIVGGAARNMKVSETLDSLGGG